jgi:hypothetical protein
MGNSSSDGLPETLIFEYLHFQKYTKKNYPLSKQFVVRPLTNVLSSV